MIDRRLLPLLVLFTFALVQACASQTLENLSYPDKIHLQQALISGDWLNGSADGVIGPMSRRAFESFELDWTGKSNGVVDPKEEAYLIAPLRGATSFEILANIDLPGFDYRSGFEEDGLSDISLSVCQKQCAADSKCMAYTYNVSARVCFLKTSGFSAVGFPGAVSGRRGAEGADLASVADFEVLEGFDLPGNDFRSGMDEATLRNTTAQACQSQCLADNLCAAYTFDTINKVCFLKDASSDTVSYAGAISGLRLAGSPEPVPTSVPAAKPEVDIADLEIGQDVDVATGVGTCEVAPTHFKAIRRPLNPLHQQVLAVVVHYERGTHTEDTLKAAAISLLPKFRAAVESAQGTVSREQMALLKYDLAILMSQAGETGYTDLRAEAVEVLTGFSNNLEAAEVGIAIYLDDIFRANPEDVSYMRRLLAHHNVLAGPVDKQAVLYDAMQKVADVYAPSQELIEIRDEVLLERQRWSKTLRNRGAEIEAIGADLSAKINDVTSGFQAEAGQLTHLLETAREILPDVKDYAQQDLLSLIPYYEASMHQGDATEPCLSVSKETVAAVMNVILAEGTSAERRQVLEFGVLHSLNVHMFATDPNGAISFAANLLGLRLSDENLFLQAATYVSANLICLPDQPRSACSLHHFSLLFEEFDNGAIALDFSRSALAIAAAHAPGSQVEAHAARALALLEWRHGSVSKAEDLMSQGLQDEALDMALWDYRMRQDYVDLKAERTALNAEDDEFERMLTAIITDRQAEQAGIAEGAAQIMETVDPLPMVLSYALGQTCTTCSDALAKTVAGWAEEELARGWAPSMLVLRLIGERATPTRRLESLASDYLSMLDESGYGQISFAQQKQIRSLRPGPMSDLQLATVLALALTHPQLPDPYGDFPLAFSRFMFETDVARKQDYYDVLFNDFFSHLEEFGGDGSYAPELIKSALIAREIGFALAANVMDKHIVDLFENKLDRLGDNRVLRAVAQAENAEDVVPALMRLAQASLAADDPDQAHQIVQQAQTMALQSLEANWRTGDQRVVIKLRRLAESLESMARIASDLANDGAGSHDLAFSSLQLAMLGDTAITAQAAQRRRALADPNALRALNMRDEASDALALLDYYRQTIGISDPEWEVEETKVRTTRLKSAQRELETYFSSDLDVRLAPMSIAETQQLLRPNELLIVLHAGQERVHGMAVGSGSGTLSWQTELSIAELNDKIDLIRSGVEIQDDGSLPPFPFASANAVLVDLLGPALNLALSQERLVIVVDGPLQKLPFSVLPIALPETLPDAIEDYRDAEIRWLGSEKALSFLPIIAGLRERLSSATLAPKPFGGFGNPNFRPDLSTGPGAEAKVPSPFYDLEDLQHTQTELSAMAQISGAQLADVLVSDAATEAAVKAFPLRDYQVLLFATHGLLAGELEGFDEPGIALTPQYGAGDGNEGYLGLSEITTLEMNAELVILSACNTASGDSSNPSGYSGLARGFIGAGARSVAVTHWSIPDDATLSLNGLWFGAKYTRSDIDWPEAMRVAIGQMITSEGPPRFAHPANWGAFVIYGSSDRMSIDAKI